MLSERSISETPWLLIGHYDAYEVSIVYDGKWFVYMICLYEIDVQNRTENFFKIKDWLSLKNTLKTHHIQLYFKAT